MIGVPATVEHRINLPSENLAVRIAECVHNYIGAMDTLKLNMAAKDQLGPCLEDLNVSLYKVPQLPAEFTGKLLLKEWIQRLDTMCASDELGEADVRQLLYDIENSYDTFLKLLGRSEQ